MQKPTRLKGKVKPSPAVEGARKLAALRGLPLVAIYAAMADDVLNFGKRQGFLVWFWRDADAGSVRRLDGKPWRFADSQAKACDAKGTSGKTVSGWPVGLLKACERQNIIVCEGAPDALAAYALREQTEADFGIVAVLGAALTICEKALPHFAGKRVRFIAHADPPGLEFAERNAKWLHGFAESISIATLDSISDADGKSASDLCDALAFRQPANLPDRVARLFDFGSTSPNVRPVAATDEPRGVPQSKSERVTQDDTKNTHRIHRNTQQKERENADGPYEKARELASSGRGQSNKQLFALAREVLRYEAAHCGEDRALRDTVFEVWFHASYTNLDPLKTRAAYLVRFHSKFQKVRKLPGQRDALREAEARARGLILPEIPGAPDAEDGWRKVAAVMRELQREAGDAPFFISTRAAARIGGQIHATEGARILEALAFFGVVECVRKGKAGVNTGKASEYRYRLPA